MREFFSRVIRAAKLDVSLYDEVIEDRSALTQALGVVVLSGLAAAAVKTGAEGYDFLLKSAVLAVVGWFLWSLLIFLVGTKLFQEPKTDVKPGQVLRAIGFSTAPGLALLFGLVPYIGFFVEVVAKIWMFLAIFVAVKQSLGYRTVSKAVVVCLFSVIVVIFFLIVFVSISSVASATSL